MKLSRIVHQKDVGNRLIRDLKSQMLRSIGSSSLLTPVEIHTLKTRVSAAALAEFRAEVWRIDLNRLATSPLRPAIGLSAHKRDWRTNALTEVAKTPPQVLQPDEYLIKDLQQSGATVEYEVIIET